MDGSAYNPSVNLGHYTTGYTYDAAGNLLTLTRNGEDGTQSDNFNYEYYGEGTDAPTNRLANVDGHASNHNDYANYTYDAIGNLVSDISEDISAIEWTVYGKVKSVHKGTGEEVRYRYGADGNRVRKTVLFNDIPASETWYARDASGNPMAIYTESYGLDTPRTTTH